jgi:putative acetyltransferase
VTDQVRIASEPPDQPDVLALLAASDALMASLYPAESNHMLSPAELMGPGRTFLVARLAGDAVGCGAVVVDGREAELKRMFVPASQRGRGFGRRLLGAAEDAARAAGAVVIRLETGVAQPEAIGLYRAAGYVERGPFGAYGPDPLSLFMEKPL